MTRRRSSVAEDIAEITSRMPWWVGVVLAAVMTKGLATGGQYVLPSSFFWARLYPAYGAFALHRCGSSTA